MKNIGNLFVRLFVVSLLAFRYFSTVVSLFGAGAAPFFYGSGSGQNVSAPAAPAPHPCFRRIVLVKMLNVTYFELRHFQQLIIFSAHGFT